MVSALAHTRIITSELSNKKNKPPHSRRPTTTIPEAVNPTRALSDASSSSATNHRRRLKSPKSNVGRKENLRSFTKSLCDQLESGSLESALQLFYSMPQLDAFLWNVIIKGLVDYGVYDKAVEFYHRMQTQGFKSDHFTYPFVIKACAELLLLDEGQKIHSKLVKNGLTTNAYISNSLISMYAKMECIVSAERVFEEMGTMKDVVSWNSVMSGYVSVGDGLRTLEYFRKMQDSDAVPDRFSYMSSLCACSLEGLLRGGKEVHCRALRNGLETDVKIQTAIVDMYCKCGRVDIAEKFFNSMPQRCLGAWNALVGGYALCNLPYDSLSCLRNMQQVHKLAPDEITLINVLPACAQSEALVLGKSIHSVAIRRGLLPHVILHTALINTYGACGSVRLAEQVFRVMGEKNIVSWNAMITAYVENESFKEAMDLFKELISQPDLKSDSVTVASILPAYAELASVAEAKQIHGYITRSVGLVSSNTHILNALVDMYAKCGDLTSSRKIFKRIPVKDVISWNTIIMAHALHGFGKESLRLLSEMIRERRIEPNRSTFVSLLSSCSVSGMFDEGWEYFDLMKRVYSIDPGIEHYGCMLDLLGRRGDLDSARAFIEDMPLAPTARIWGSLLAASVNSKNVEMAEFAANRIFSIEHDNTGCYILLYNMYAELERWADVERIKDTMEKKGLKKTKGCSTVEVSGNRHVFFVGDCSSSSCVEGKNRVYETLDVLHRWVKEDCYVHTLTKFRPEEVAKKRAKSAEFHSARLGIAFGLVSTGVGKPVSVRKNVKICKECHGFAKAVSGVTGREIVVGDSKVFHHFSGGSCSCGDYW